MEDMLLKMSVSACGNIQKIEFGGEQFACEERNGEGLFLIQLRDFVGNPLQLAVRDFKEVSFKEENGVFRWNYSACEPLGGTEVELTAESAGKQIRWNIRVVPGSADFQVEWMDFPRVRLSVKHSEMFLLPYAEGTLLDARGILKPDHSQKCSIIDYPMTGIDGFYPGPVAMQFLACYTEKAGLFCMCNDVTHAPKTVDIAVDKENTCRLQFQHFTQGGTSLEYQVIMEGFFGEWQEATEIYRAWMEANDPLLPAKGFGHMPQWLKDSPVILAYPVKGYGLDQGGLIPNEFYPYKKALPVMERYQKAWNNPVMALLMHWEGTAPWAPPYVWPPYGGVEEFRDFVSAVHDAGNLVGLYASGIAWTHKSMIDKNYNLFKEFEEKNVGDEICVGPRGETFSRVCNGYRAQRIGYDLCPGRAFTTDLVTNEVRGAADAGVDYFQYFDQNQGAASPLCYSKKHGHPALPGKWQTEAMGNLLSAAADAAGNMIIGCENAAAEPYIGSCRLNDLRNHLAWARGGVPVPVYPYLFHEYTSGFSGNGVCATVWIDQKETPFYVQWNLAWNFAAGNVLTVVLKDGGKIHWHWAIHWEVEPPVQEPLVKLIGNLSFWRRGVANKALTQGRMVQTPDVQCASKRIYLTMREPQDVPAVISSAWENEGKTLLVLANYNENEEPCRVNFGKSVKGVIFTRNGEQNFEGDSLILKVAELDAAVIEFA